MKPTHDLDHDGFQIVPAILSAGEVETFRKALQAFAIAPGHRNLMERVPEIAKLAVSSEVLDLLTSFLGIRPFPVRSIFFDKTSEANWLVPWHQDLSIATRSRIEIPGYGPWSAKEGVPHVQPPVEILESMITVRIHLDDCDETNGALRVVPGSHQLGRIDGHRGAEIRSQKGEILCSAKAGDALLMRPLLLHASSQATVPGHRRVIHLEYATSHLPNGLKWAENEV